MNTTFKQEVINLCQDLIRKSSYSGHEQNVADILKTYMQKINLTKFLLINTAILLDVLKQ